MLHLKLTARQKQILAFLKGGYKPTEIAKIFTFSPVTINTHVRNILYKRGCETVKELIEKC